MADHSRLIKVYAHFCRFCGCFPLQFGPDRTLKFSLISLPTLYTLTVSLLYFTSVVDYLYTVAKSHRDSKTPLSEMLLLFPSTIGCALSDLIIRVAAVAYAKELIKLIQILQNLPSPSVPSFTNSIRTSKLKLIIYTGLALYGLYAVVSFIMYSVWFPEDSISVLCNCSSCENYRLVSTALFMCDLWHDGAVLCATSFLAIFGFQLVKHFHIICGNISVYRRGNWDIRMRSILGIGEMDVAPKDASFAVSNGVDVVNAFRNQFYDLKLSFDIFSKIGGTFTLALLFEIVTVLFYAAGNALLESSSTEVAEFLQPFLYNLMTVVIFMIIVEMGNHMVTELQASREELEDVLACGYCSTMPFSVEAKQVL